LHNRKKAEIAHENAKSTEEKNEEVAEDSLQILSPELGIAIRIGGINIHMSFLHSKNHKARSYLFSDSLLEQFISILSVSV